MPGITNNLENVTNTYSASSRVELNSNISENIDFKVSYVFDVNHVDNSVQAGQSGQYSIHNITGKFNFSVWRGFVMRSDINYQNYKAVQGDFDTEYLLWNITVAKKLLKNESAEIAFSVFDLLNQNKGISQSVSANYIEETKSLVLKQYFMISARYNIRKFSA